jgi:acetyl esterase/lipase
MGVHSLKRLYPNMKSILPRILLLSVFCLMNPLNSMTYPETTDSTTWIPLFETPPKPNGASTPPSEHWEDGRLSKVANPRIGLFLVESEEPRPCVVICPGGGYRLLSMEKEGYEVARYFNNLGIHACVLVYRLEEYGYPAPLIDTTRAIRMIRAKAREWNVRSDQIGIMGFSAGGHAAALASTLFNSPDTNAGDAMDSISPRPDFSILVYPVLSTERGVAHEGSVRALLGEGASPERRAQFSLDKRVNSETPPTFIMHSADDASVPVENALKYAAALSAHSIPFSLHVYPFATHGMGMRPGFGSASSWPDALTTWLREARLVD